MLPDLQGFDKPTKLFLCSVPREVAAAHHFNRFKSSISMTTPLPVWYGRDFGAELGVKAFSTERGQMPKSPPPLKKNPFVFF
uniref:Uncharacterized protein n=1 Tax=Steinernema glaseri TaxID=37863 RepID=A0A1I7Z5Z3_9BILA